MILYFQYTYLVWLSTVAFGLCVQLENFAPLSHTFTPFFPTVFGDLTFYIVDGVFYDH